MSTAIRLDWGDGGDIRSAELRATWCTLSIELAGRLVTLVRSGSGGPRTGVHVAAYPLAEWIVEYWHRILEWQQAGGGTRRKGISMRLAGEGMAWPDLRFLATGDEIRCTWEAGQALIGNDLEFLASDAVTVPRGELERAFVDVVESVVSRLHDSGIRESVLENRWAVLRQLSREEDEFVTAAARLGLDGFDLTEIQEHRILDADERVPAELLSPLLDSTDIDGLPDAVEWLENARLLEVPRTEPVAPLEWRNGHEPPWTFGYRGALELRERLGAEELRSFPIERWVPAQTLGERSGGVEAYSATTDNRTAVVFSAPGRLPASTRFNQARALGYWVLFSQPESLLPRSHRWEDQATRAFAAELLLPSHDLRHVARQVHGYWTEAVEDRLADEYQVSTRLVRDQLENHAILERD